MFDLFNIDLQRQRQADYTDALMRTMRAARSGRQLHPAQQTADGARGGEPRRSGQQLTGPAAADCG